MPRPSRFTPGNDLVPTVQGAGWASELVWMGAENLAHFVYSIINNTHANELQQDDTSTLKHTILDSGKKKIQ